MTMNMTTDMTTITTTSTEPSAMAPGSLLRLMWLASPALPVGAFSYSESLEAAVDSQQVANETQVQAWLLDQLALAQARADLPVAAAAHAAFSQNDAQSDAERLQVLNDWVLHTRESAELRQQTLQTGRSMAAWLGQRMGVADARWQLLNTLAPAPTWPLAFALAALHAGANARDALLAMAFGWAENMVQAAVKAVPLGQSAGQRVLQALVDALPGHIEQALALADDERQAFAPMLAILSAQHEHQYSRLFRS